MVSLINLRVILQTYPNALNFKELENSDLIDFEDQQNPKEENQKMDYLTKPSTSTTSIIFY